MTPSPQQSTFRCGLQWRSRGCRCERLLLFSRVWSRATSLERSGGGGRREETRVVSAVHTVVCVARQLRIASRHGISFFPSWHDNPKLVLSSDAVLEYFLKYISNTLKKHLILSLEKVLPDYLMCKSAQSCYRADVWASVNVVCHVHHLWCVGNLKKCTHTL